MEWGGGIDNFWNYTMEVYQDWSEYPDIQIEAEVLVERSIFDDVFYHLVTCSLNWKQNGSREENMNCFLGNENDQSCCQKVKALFPGFLLTFDI